MITLSQFFYIVVGVLLFLFGMFVFSLGCPAQTIDSGINGLMMFACWFPAVGIVIMAAGLIMIIVALRGTMEHE